MLKSRVDLGLLILRIGTSVLLFTGHGWPKLMQFNERLNTFANPIGLGSPVSFLLVLFVEVVCAMLVLFGFLTRWAVIPLIFFFLIAAFIQHADDPWSRKEFALIYLTPCLTLLFTGPGRFSVDGKRGGRSS